MRPVFRTLAVSFCSEAYSLAPTAPESFSPSSEDAGRRRNVPSDVHAARITPGKSTTNMNSPNRPESGAPDSGGAPDCGARRSRPAHEFVPEETPCEKVEEGKSGARPLRDDCRVDVAADFLGFEIASLAGPGDFFRGGPMILIETTPIKSGFIDKQVNAFRTHCQQLILRIQRWTFCGHRHAYKNRIIGKIGFVQPARSRR
jgi:hypothetical protein